MRFLRWYGRLIKKAFALKEECGYLLYLRNRLVDILKFYLVTMSLWILVALLWLSMPEFARESITNVAISIWLLVKPLFDWFADFDWAGIADKIDNGVHQLESFIFHLMIGLVTVIFAMLIMTTIADLIRIIVLRTEVKKENKKVIMACLLISVLVGYYVTTSSYGVATVNWIVSQLTH